jgi:transcription elongation factor GreB
MSKAFTRESDDSGEEQMPPFRTQLPPGSKNYITKQGADRLKRDLDELLEKKQAGTAGPEQQKNEWAIKKLQQALKSVIVAEPPADQDKIAFGATVVIRHDDSEEETYHIVGVEEARPELGSISWISPLARALLSRRAGDTVRFRTPAGETELAIVSVRYE